MHDTEKFMITEGIVFYAFAFALQSHPLLSFFSASAAILMTLQFHPDVFWKRVPHILWIFLLQLAVIQLTDMESLIPYIAVLAAASLISTDIWLYACGGKLHKVMNILMFGLAVYMILILAIEDLPFGKLHSTGIALLVYGPVIYEYIYHTILQERETRRKNRDRKHMTAVE